MDRSVFSNQKGNEYSGPENRRLGKQNDMWRQENLLQATASKPIVQLKFS